MSDAKTLSAMTETLIVEMDRPIRAQPKQGSGAWPNVGWIIIDDILQMGKVSMRAVTCHMPKHPSVQTGICNS